MRLRGILTALVAALLTGPVVGASHDAPPVRFTTDLAGAGWLALAPFDLAAEVGLNITRSASTPSAAGVVLYDDSGDLLFQANSVMAASGNLVVLNLDGERSTVSSPFGSTYITTYSKSQGNCFDRLSVSMSSDGALYLGLGVRPACVGRDASALFWTASQEASAWSATLHADGALVVSEAGRGIGAHVVRQDDFTADTRADVRAETFRGASVSAGDDATHSIVIERHWIGIFTSPLMQLPTWNAWSEHDGVRTPCRCVSSGGAGDAGTWTFGVGSGATTGGDEAILAGVDAPFPWELTSSA